MDFFILILLMFTFVWLMKFLLRKALNIPKVKRKPFSYNHINKAHQNAEWVLRITTVMGYLILFYQLIYGNFSVNLFLLIMTLLFTAQNFLRAYFEWKVSDQPKKSILSIAEGIMLIGIVMLLIQFDILNNLAQ